MFKSFRTEIAPTRAQVALLRRFCGSARFVYNWGLAERQRVYEEEGRTLAFNEQMKTLTQKKREAEFEWLNEAPAAVYQASLYDLDRAFQHFFRRVKQGEAPGYPRFKAKGRARLSIRSYSGGKVIGEDRQHVQFPKLGRLRVKERGYLPTDARIIHVTLSEEAGRWFVAVAVEVPDVTPEPATGPALGVDLGIKALATLSDGTVFDNPKATARQARRLRRLQRKMARQVKGSAAREKTKQAIRRVHYRTKCLRADATHKATAIIAAKGAAVVVVEDLCVRGMQKNGRLAKAVSDANFSEMRRQIAYKVPRAGGRVVVADRFFASSKTCSACGVKKDRLRLSERVFRCEACGHREDRDVNAAKNLARLADSGST